jgi:flagellar hook-associated protein 3 FlgL
MRTMRISTGWSYIRLAQQMVRQERELHNLQMAISTGKRVNRPSDDPVATGQILGAKASASELTAQEHTITQGHLLLRYSDQVVGEMCSGITQVRELLLRAANDTLSPLALESLAQEINMIRESMMQLGNSQLEGRYLFAGRLDLQPPLVETADPAHPVEYRGDSVSSTYRVGKDATVAVTIPGDRLFNFENASGERAITGVDTDLFSCLAAAEEAVRTGDKQQIQAASEQVNSFANHMLLCRGQIGVEDRRLELLEGVVQEGKLRMAEALSALQDCDMAEALTRLQMLQVLYQATLGVAAKAASLPSLVELEW